VTRSFCNLRTHTRLLAYIKHPVNGQLNKLKSPRIDSPPLHVQGYCYYLLYSSEMTLKCPKDAFWGASKSILPSHNHSEFSARHDSNTTSDVTRIFWPRQDSRQFWAQPANFERLKKPFSLTVCKKKSAVFLSKVERLLPSKNLTYQNFVSL